MNQCKKILVVEDNDDIRDAISEALELEGFSVDTARNGKEGLAKLRKTSGPTLVLLDLMMPVMNGWEFLDAKNLQADRIPVLVISAVPGNPHIPGALGFLKKPVDLDRLMDFIELYCA